MFAIARSWIGVNDRRCRPGFLSDGFRSVWDVLTVPGGEVVEGVIGDECVSDVVPDESRAAGNENALASDAVVE